LNPAITGLRIFGHGLGISYNWPILPGRRRLKHLYFWKNTASGIGFLVTVFGYPLATINFKGGQHIFPEGISWSTVIVSAVFFYLFIQSYEIIYDLRDLKGDHLAGIQTYPVVHGEKTAGYLIDALIYSSMAVLLMGYWFSAIPWRIFVMIGAPFLQLIVYKPAMRRGITEQDCIRITWLGAALFIIYHLWVVAGLPGCGVK
jgi:4-hydroxybenzoate polyprenyltransferase